MEIGTQTKKSICLSLTANWLVARKNHWAALTIRHSIQDFLQWQHLKVFNSIRSVDLEIEDTCNQMLGACRKQQTGQCFHDTQGPSCKLEHHTIEYRFCCGDKWCWIRASVASSLVPELMWQRSALKAIFHQNLNCASLYFWS